MPDLTAQQLAEAFSGHRFAETYDQIAPGVRWDNVGGDTYEGRDALVAACEGTLAYLEQALTEVQSSRTIVGAGGASVVVDVVVRYTADGEATTVASCDIYDVADAQITAIRSYTVEIAG